MGTHAQLGGYDAEAVAAMLRVSPKTVRKMIRDGGESGFRPDEWIKIGREYRVKPAGVARMLDVAVSDLPAAGSSCASGCPASPDPTPEPGVTA